MMTDRAGGMFAERSAILGTWFPEGVPSTLEEMFAHDPMFPALWDQLIDFLPPELGVVQLPRELIRGDQVLEITWRPILDGDGRIARVLVVLSDVTDARRREDAEAEQIQIMAIFECLSRDREGVIEFAREASNMVAELARATAPADVERRLVHTLKGNSSLFGLSRLAKLCHHSETAMIDDDRALLPDERAQICAAWHAIDARLARFLDPSARYLQVVRSDFESAWRALAREHHPVASDLELWTLESLETRFERIADQVRALAERLGKAPVRVLADPAGARIDGPTWSAFWAAFVHAIRNAVDHGLEPHDERVALGKGDATIQLRAGVSDGEFVIEFGDDGRGIAWDELRDTARAAGLPAASHDDLIAALFSAGISTKQTVDETSGRGVGTSALHDACAAMGGRISVDSHRGEGTTWRFVFPAHLARLPRERTPPLPCGILVALQAQ